MNLLRNMFVTHDTNAKPAVIPWLYIHDFPDDGKAQVEPCEK